MPQIYNYILLTAFVIHFYKVTSDIDQQIITETNSDQLNTLTTITQNNLKIGDTLTCEVIEQNIVTKQQCENKIYTEGSEDYIFLPAPEKNCFTFRIQTERNAVIMLTDLPSKKINQLIQFFIGGFLSSSLSVVQRTNNYHIANQISTPNILNESEYRGFWIKWNSTGFAEIGREKEKVPFLSYKEESQIFPINFIGLRTWKVPGIWILEGEDCRPEIPEDKYNLVKYLNFETKCQILRNNTINNKLTRSRLLQNNLLNQLKSDFQSFNKQYYRSKVFLQMCFEELEIIFRKATELQNDILSSLIKDEENSATIKDYLKENIFEEIRTIYFEYYGILQLELNKISNVQINSGNTKTEEEQIRTHELPYQYYEYSVTTEGCFYFKIRAIRDLYITLSNNPNPSKPYIEIIIGGLLNTKSSLRKNNHENLVEVATPYILSDNVYQSFRVIWKSDGVIKVERGNDTEPFLIWKEINLFPVKYVGIVTANGVNGQWIVENNKCEPDRHVNRNFLTDWSKHKKTNINNNN